MLKILAPFNSVAQVKPLVQAGADELYCGVVGRDWLSGDFCVEDLNKEPSLMASLQSYEELEASVKEAASSDVPIFVLLNAQYYTSGQYPFLIDVARKIDACGAAAVIVSDIGLMIELAKLDLKMQMFVSKITGCMNRESMLFFHKLGCNRVVFPEPYCIDELIELTRAVPDMETELYILNGGCRYVETCCNFMHMEGIVSPAKRWLFNVMKPFFFEDKLFTFLRMLPRPVRSFLENRQELSFLTSSVCTMAPKTAYRDRQGTLKTLTGSDKPDYFRAHFFDQTTLCSLCFLPRMASSGATSLKIMGRGYCLDKKIKDVRLVKKALDYLEHHGDDQDAYSRVMRQFFKETFGYSCDENCGYCW